MSFAKCHVHQQLGTSGYHHVLRSWERCLSPPPAVAALTALPGSLLIYSAHNAPMAGTASRKLGYRERQRRSKRKCPGGKA